MTIRIANQSDIPSLVGLLQDILQVHHQARPDIFKSSGQKFSEADLIDLLEQPNKPVFVYELDGQVVGHLFCELSSVKNGTLEPIKTLFIDDLCVANSVRGQRIGEQLYDFAFSYAKEQGCYNVTLDVWADNTRAVRFYERLGMKPQKLRMEQFCD
ncbi:MULTISPECIES: GNAT family N-acetyltransferase [Streptococcus]|uniref:N-acetyltransferase n=1 Tax=Streptococcus ruminantium TaxID=1917441 RepID=A0A2Z5TL79_9STRE|nr:MULTISPECIES: GNAT family N-acetyltransferase [Streptococcus]MDQ8759526.1 GNAT family N-acetyltransferase [Streptococcus ruminantium]MDQ8764431.1 GNAT family N-acetyltransferase [Streptococcus ruminantium]MDQ8766893.1 GNAT family N-acetyltransferase [Streptococcus ruminantium]MDQ8768465.1 GNAT family N-acetyltransferase [Streptococcus ruminantium]MDQ8774339.1 GNAT family N-acetyltransferase [Streptococcus ruminantium]